MFATRKPIRGNTDLPDGARRTGEYTHNGLEILAEEEIVYELRQALDAAGEPVYRLNRAGEKIGKVMVQTPVGSRERRFVLDDLGNNMVVKNYDFAPELGELERLASRDKVDPSAFEQRLARLEAALEATGLTLEDAEELADTMEHRQQVEAVRGERLAEIEARRVARRDETPEQRAARLRDKAARREQRRTGGAGQ